MNPIESQQNAARADFARFLAACYYEPEAAFAQERLFDSMAGMASHFDADLEAASVRLGKGFEADRLEDLLVDYTRLFLGPVDALAMPYGSVWLGTESTLMQDSTVAVLALYAEGGFEIDEAFRELPDHIAAELEFLYLLLYREGSGSTGIADVPGLKARFLGEHLGRWAGPFASAVRANAQTAFYRELAAITGRFLEDETKRAGASWKP